MAVLLVASQAAQALVNADRRPIVSGKHLHFGTRRVALVAEGLPPVRARLHRSGALLHRRQGQSVERDVPQSPAVVVRE